MELRVVGDLLAEGAEEVQHYLPSRLIPLVQVLNQLSQQPLIASEEPDNKVHKTGPFLLQMRDKGAHRLPPGPQFPHFEPQQAEFQYPLMMFIYECG